MGAEGELRRSEKSVPCELSILTAHCEKRETRRLKIFLASIKRRFADPKICRCPAWRDFVLFARSIHSYDPVIVIRYLSKARSTQAY